jgi:hypothetical protein
MGLRAFFFFYGINHKTNFLFSSSDRFVFSEHEWIEKVAKRELTKNERLFVQSTKFALGQLSFEEFSINISTINESK